MVCGATLEYLQTAVDVTCNYCGKEEIGYVRCPKGHYVCDECHGKGAFDLIKDITLTTMEKDPLSIAELLMAHPKIPFLGCEHALIATSSLLAALKNDGALNVSNEQIVEAMTRTQKQSMPPYCKEEQSKNVSVRKHRHGDLGSHSLRELIKTLKAEIQSKKIS